MPEKNTQENFKLHRGYYHSVYEDGDIISILLDADWLGLEDELDYLSDFNSMSWKIVFDGKEIVLRSCHTVYLSDMPLEFEHAVRLIKEVDRIKNL